MARAKRKKQVSKKKKQSKPAPAAETPAPNVSKHLREGIFLLFIFTAAYLFVTLISYSPLDKPMNYTGDTKVEIKNLGGLIGAWISYLLYLFVGYLSYLLPVIFLYIGWLVFRVPAGGKGPGWGTVILRLTGFVITVVSGTALATLNFHVAQGQLPDASAGGELGRLVSQQLYGFGPLGGSLLLLAIFLIGFTLMTSLSWLALIDTTGRITLKLFSGIGRLFDGMRERRIARRARRERERALKEEQKRARTRKKPKLKAKKPRIRPSGRVEKEKQVQLFDPPLDTDLPPLSLLDEPQVSEQGYSEEELEMMSRRVEIKLRDFGVEARVDAVLPGPVVTLFEIELAPGVKVSQVTNLAKDLARALSAISVRVVDIIPGKSVIGLEIPNEQRELITLSEILRSQEYDEASSVLSVALGKDISGNPMVVDLERMPHLLIAGTTGSGKSVALNAMVLSLIYKANAVDVRMIMIDPKMLELSVYEGIPHLLTPVVTDMKDAANALRWCVGEMERRYRLMAALGVRNITGYNRKVRKAIAQGEPVPDPLYIPDEEAGVEEEPPTLQPLPFIVVIVDELADMMMMVGKKVEELIARLAQKARASGIHLILATQRPSVNVITGLIKANIPTRIAFQVSARVDSRTILDQMGAEQLLGHGDMLYLSPGSGVPRRVHGAFVSDQEVHKVVSYLQQRSAPDYIDDIVGEQNDPDTLLPGETPQNDGDPEQDPLFDEAVYLVTQSRRASISSVQRRLKIGYNRAARIMEAMENAGIVSEMQSNGSREVLAPAPPEE